MCNGHLAGPMNPIILVADASPEIGWGHAMRTLAVAQALNQYTGLVGTAGNYYGLSVVWATNTPEAIRKLGPPCPVSDVGARVPSAGATHLVDLPSVAYSGTANSPETFRVVAMVDAPDQWLGADIRICPHFGSESWDWGLGAVCTGPQWMPLRDLITPHGLALYNPDAPVLAYRPPKDWTLGLCAEGAEPHQLAVGGGESWWKKAWCSAVVPASTISYECMRSGIPVVLHKEGQGEEHERIMKGMVEAGVASIWGDNVTTLTMEARAKKAHRLVDGQGAERVAGLLMAGGAG